LGSAGMTSPRILGRRKPSIWCSSTCPVQDAALLAMALAAAGS
jgi:hypothetical protein